MTRVFLLLFILLFPIQALAELGVVIKEDVCGSGNVIIETIDGGYVAAEHYSGVTLFKGDIVSGNLRTYGFEKLIRMDNRESGDFFVVDCQSSTEKAKKVLCNKP